MAIYRRGKNKEWWYHFFYKNRHIQERTGTNNKQEARRLEATRRAELLLGKEDTKVKSNSKFSEFAVPYLEFSKANKSSYGVEVYYINGPLVLFFGDFQLDKITPFDVERFKQKRLKDGLKKSSINREIGLLKSMLRTAVEWELTNRNGAKEAKLFKLDEPPSDRVLSYAEEDKLLAACGESELRYRAPHLKSIVAVALYTGLCFGSAGNGEVTLSVNEDSAPSGRGFSRHERLSSDAGCW